MLDSVVLRPWSSTGVLSIWIVFHFVIPIVLFFPSVSVDLRGILLDRGLIMNCVRCDCAIYIAVSLTPVN